MSERVFIVTGGNSGIGYHAAAELAKAPAHRVIIASRNPDRVQTAVNEIRQATGNDKVEGMTLNLSSLTAVKEFAQAFKAKYAALHGLVCNAGLVCGKFQLSEDGFESTFATNHLGHHLLVRLLLDVLQDSGSESDPARIAVVASGTHDPAQKTGAPVPNFNNCSELLFNDGSDPKTWDSAQAYTNSKMCNVLFSYELYRKLKATGGDRKVAVFCYDPGFIPETSLMREYHPIVKAIVANLVGPILRWWRPTMMSTAAASGTFLAKLAMDDSYAADNGKFFIINKVGPSSTESYNEVKAGELWSSSEELLSKWLP